MAMIFTAPSRYIQGKGELKNLQKHLSSLGKKALVIDGKIGTQSIPRDAEGCKLVFTGFGGECTRGEIARIQALFLDQNCDVLVGAGGGKIQDTAKAAAHFLKAPVMIIPTAASTDAPCSALSILYEDDGTRPTKLPLSKGPDVILIDSQVIADAPAKLLAAGMGDALSTYYEARACANSGAFNIHGGHATKTAFAIADLCNNTLIQYGKEAYRDVQQNQCTEAVEAIIEANTLMSGIGFEGCGKGAIHPIGDALSDIAACRSVLHGEKVAFATLVQLILEDAMADFYRTLDFLSSVGLPVTLAQIGLSDGDTATIKKIADATASPESASHNLPFPVTSDQIHCAILRASALGAQALQ